MKGKTMPDLLIPVKIIRRDKGFFSFSKQTVASSIFMEDRLPILQLTEDLTKYQINLLFSRDTIKGQILFRRNKIYASAEEYELHVFPHKIEIFSATQTGAYYAIQTLRDLIHIHGTRLPCCHMHDWPTFTRRAIYYDCSRGKVPTVNTVKELIERLAHWKMNELQLYIENTFTFQKHPKIGRGFSPFTPEDILAIQKHCTRHHIRLVPSLASLGHMEKILFLPEYQSLAEMPGYRGYAGGMTLCPGNPGSIRLIEEMYEEFIPLFKAEDFNICGDEPWELGQGRSKSAVEKFGKGKVYLDFILKIHKLCLKHGKRMNMWADIVLQHPEILPNLPKDIVLLNWDYVADGTRIPQTEKFNKADLSFMCCPGTAGWQSHGTRLDQALDNVSVFAKVAKEQKAEGLLHTDWGDYGHRNTLGVSLCSFAHGAAHSWAPAEVNDKTFVETFCYHTFGSPGLGKSLQVLGSTKSWAYYSIVSGLLKEQDFCTGFARFPHNLQKVSFPEREIKKQIQKLESLKWPKPSRNDPSFESIALQEFSLATDMDRLAWQRQLFRTKFKNKITPLSGELKKHALEMRKMAKEFSRIWNLRNRPSRLSDNMAGFKGAILETENLAK
jgi:hypothetical protein